MLSKTILVPLANHAQVTKDKQTNKQTNKKKKKRRRKTSDRMLSKTILVPGANHAQVNTNNFNFCDDVEIRRG